MNEAQQIMGGVDYPLNKKINAHGEELSQLTLRRPTTEEVRKLGRMPYQVLDTAGRLTPDMTVMPDYIVVCAGIPMSAVNQRDLMDLNQLSGVSLGFFTQPESSVSSN